MLVHVTIPVFNEENRLPACLETLVPFLDSTYPGHYELVIANNASTDATREIAEDWSGKSSIRTLHLPRKGRGWALREAWTSSQAAVLSYMDVDLSTGLGAFPGLVAAVADRRCDLAVGSRLLPQARTHRGWRREFVSCAYNRLIQCALGTRFSDAQCGFKAISAKAAQSLLPR